MATDTPNFNWPIPEDTDLVKDGAKAIRDLGNAIDTSAQDFGGGLVHINTESTGGAVSSFSINNIFSSEYKRYKITFRGTRSSRGEVSFRLRNGTTDETSSNYLNVRIFRDSASLGSGYTTGETSNRLGFFETDSTTVELNITNPFEAVKKSYFSLTGSAGVTSATFQGIVVWDGGGLNLVNSYDGITILTGSADTINGVFNVYGFKE